MIAWTQRPAAVSWLMAVLLTSSCGTALNDFNDKLTITSEPAGARVTLSDGQSCTTPCSITVPRHQELVADIVKANCNPVREVLYSLPPAGNSDWISWSRLYSALDYEVGSAYHVSPNPLAIHLFCGEKPPTG